MNKFRERIIGLLADLINESYGELLTVSLNIVMDIDKDATSGDNLLEFDDMLMEMDDVEQYHSELLEIARMLECFLDMSGLREEINQNVNESVSSLQRQIHFVQSLTGYHLHNPDY